MISQSLNEIRKITLQSKGDNQVINDRKFLQDRNL